MGCLLLYKMETIRESVKRGMGGAIYGIASVTILVRFLQIYPVHKNFTCNLAGYRLHFTYSNLIGRVRKSMRKKWIFTGAAFALAMTLTGCRDNAAASIPQQSSQEQTEVADSTVPATAQTSAAAPAQNATGTGTVDEAAQKIALEHAGVKAADATITKSKLDYEDGRQVYDIEWYVGGAKYDYEIAADTGEIISSAYEEKTMGADSKNVTVSEADAKKTALDRVSGATDKDLYEWKLDYDDGRPEYEGKIIYGGTEYEFTIDAATGSVMEWDAEKVR